MRGLGQGKGECITGRVGMCKSKTETGNLQDMRVFSYRTDLGRRKVYALSVGPERSERHEANYLLSHHHLHRLSDKMEFSKFLRIPKIRRRTRNETGDETGPIEGQSGADPVVPRPTVPTPDLRIDISTSSTTRPPVSRDQESDGMQTAFFRTIYLTTFPA